MLINTTIPVEDIIDSVNKVALAVLSIYNSPDTLGIDYKSDASPVTKADLLAHAMLTESLTRLAPKVPIVSEEQDTQINRNNITSDVYWLIDPIDGTKEFIAHNGQFTICVALMKKQKPIFGIVSAPALHSIYYGGKEYGSFKKIANTAKKIDRVEPESIIFGSLSHVNAATADYIKEHYPNCELQSVGSQLKIIYVAEGKARAYPRIGSTMKTWDIAAGHAILEGVGGVILRPNGTEIEYTNPDLLAGDFIAKI